ncbi:MAG: hypothetical protein JOZ42_02900 [Acetobacteraceae bacterium]|nr:hypothetical protein [Acetobacteraceae bacterium]
MAKQTGRQKEIVGRVMHEFKHGELETAGGRKVRNPRQAIAIGLSEAGASNRESAAANRRNKARTERKERAGKTARQQKEGPAPKRATTKRGGIGGRTRAELYREAQRRGIGGLSRASKAELEAALRRR